VSQPFISIIRRINRSVLAPQCEEASFFIVRCRICAPSRCAWMAGASDCILVLLQCVIGRGVVNTLLSAGVWSSWHRLGRRSTTRAAMSGFESLLCTWATFCFETLYKRHFPNTLGIHWSLPYIWNIKGRQCLNAHNFIWWLKGLCQRYPWGKAIYNAPYPSALNIQNISGLNKVRKLPSDYLQTFLQGP